MRLVIPQIVSEYVLVVNSTDIRMVFAVNGWTDGYAFTLSFLAPAWTIGMFSQGVARVMGTDVMLKVLLTRVCISARNRRMLPLLFHGPL
jgi:hypothetical protein